MQSKTNNDHSHEVNISYTLPANTFIKFGGMKSLVFLNKPPLKLVGNVKQLVNLILDHCYS